MLNSTVEHYGRGCVTPVTPTNDMCWPAFVAPTPASSRTLLAERRRLSPHSLHGVWATTTWLAFRTHTCSHRVWRLYQPALFLPIALFSRRMSAVMNSASAFLRNLPRMT